LDGDHVVPAVETRLVLVGVLPRVFLRAPGGTRVEPTERRGLGQLELVHLVAVRLDQHPLATLRRKARRKHVSMRPRAQVRAARVTASFGAAALFAPLVESAARPRAASHLLARVGHEARALTRPRRSHVALELVLDGEGAPELVLDSHEGSEQLPHCLGQVANHHNAIPVRQLALRAQHAHGGFYAKLLVTWPRSR
jgi:hypothetical protein